MCGSTRTNACAFCYRLLLENLSERPREVFLEVDSFVFVLDGIQGAFRSLCKKVNHLRRVRRTRCEGFWGPSLLPISDRLECFAEISDKISSFVLVLDGIMGLAGIVGDEVGNEGGERRQLFPQLCWWWQWWCPSAGFRLWNRFYRNGGVLLSPHRGVGDAHFSTEYLHWIQVIAGMWGARDCACDCATAISCFVYLPLSIGR